MALYLATYALGGYTVVTVRGALDLSNALELRDKFEAIVQAHPHLIVDLAGVPLIDSTGLSVLIRADRQAAKFGGELRLTGPQWAVRKALRTTGLDWYFAIFPSAAVAASDPPDEPDGA